MRVPRLRRMSRGGLVAALVAGPLAVLPASPALAEEVYPRPADGVFTVEGHGWGHGHGMNQWGAQGAATQGVSATTILGTYYPGTASATLANRTISVLLSDDDHTDLVTRAASGLAVKDVASGARYVLPAGPTRWRIVADSSGMRVQSYSSSWATWSTGGKSAWTGPLQFEGPAQPRVYFPNGTARDYRGVLRAARTGSSTINVLNVVDMESYLYGVVPRETSSSFHAEALKAQAVAARSYATYKINNKPSSQAYDICSTTSCQVYGGARLVTASGSVVELETTATTNAVNATKGVVRTYGGKAIFAEFSSSNGGWSTSGSQPYLQAKADPWDKIASPYHHWTGQVTAAQLEARYPAVGRLQRIRVTARDGNGDWGGRVKTVILEGVSSSGAATAVYTTGGGVYQANVWPANAKGLRGSWWRITTSSNNAAVVARGSAPTLVRPPGASTGVLAVHLKNTGSAAWPTSGLHLAVAAPEGAADPLAGGSTTPGVFVRNVTRAGATTVAPNEVARFEVRLDAKDTAAGTYTKAYMARIGTGPLFGPLVQWTVTVQNPTYLSAVAGVTGPAAASSSGAPPPVSGGTVILPRNGSVSMQVKLKNTGNVAWPLNSNVRLATSAARYRESVSSGSGWISTSVVSPVSAVEGVSGATAVKPGQVGVFTLTLHGNGQPAGVTTETFEGAWVGKHWLDGGVVKLTVVRTDPTVSRLAQAASTMAATTPLIAYPGHRRTLVFRLRNVGGSAWPVAGGEVIATANPSNRQDALRTSAWLSPTQAGRLVANVSRPGTTAVHPGEVGEYRVPIDPTNKAAGTYGEWFQAFNTATGKAYGPVVGTSVSLTAATFAGSLARNTTGLVVPASGTATYSFDLKNTGNIAWQVGGPVRVTSGSASATSTWISATRPAAVGVNLTRAGARDVKPGEVARFTFALGGNDRAPGTYTEKFGVGWEAWRAMVLSVPVTYTIR